MQGRRDIVHEQLALRLGDMSERVCGRIWDAQMADLQCIAAQLLTAKTMREAIADPKPALKHAQMR